MALMSCLTLFGFASACTSQNGFRRMPHPEALPPDILIANQLDTPICDPFGSVHTSSVTTSLRNGLKAQIRVPPSSAFEDVAQDIGNGQLLRPIRDSERPIWEVLYSYLSNQYGAVTVSREMYARQVNTPTRRFEQGFMMNTNELLQGANGDPVLEWFNVSFASGVIAADSTEESQYEFAVLSDDGARLKIAGETYFDSPNPHPTKMLCHDGGVHSSGRWVSISEDHPVDIELDYFQGPRTQIALVLLWRKRNSQLENTSSIDQSCGVSGNEAFFNSNTQESKQRYLDLTSAQISGTSAVTGGWRVIAPPNFVLPGNAENPCTE